MGVNRPARSSVTSLCSLGNMPAGPRLLRRFARQMRHEPNRGRIVREALLRPYPFTFLQEGLRLFRVTEASRRRGPHGRLVPWAGPALHGRPDERRRARRPCPRAGERGHLWVLRRPRHPGRERCARQEPRRIAPPRCFAAGRRPGDAGAADSGPIRNKKRPRNRGFLAIMNAGFASSWRELAFRVGGAADESGMASVYVGISGGIITSCDPNERSPSSSSWW